MGDALDWVAVLLILHPWLLLVAFAAGVIVSGAGLSAWVVRRDIAAQHDGEGEGGKPAGQQAPARPRPILEGPHDGNRWPELPSKAVER